MDSVNTTKTIERLKEQTFRYQIILNAFKANCIIMQNNLQRLEAAIIRSKEKAAALADKKLTEQSVLN
ncbi:hypothetical protein [Mucilaginibacter sp. AK015]|uniref:hypothetical protein n=1 Tax=Mucilaginibacter sp. AK015 TaxID=2723072 RepID=UPI001616119E|nr:hypothetical protein [Mucilaginibacter sp. AK015]MBB5397610.1 hypothetical protein [Mucilaginibacter sp. AK015]